MTAPLHVDDLAILVGEIPPSEREVRERLRGYRNAAGAMIAKTDCHTARTLAWLASDYAQGAVYSGLDEATLADVGKFCRRLMVTAMQAEEINDMIGGGL